MTLFRHLTWLVLFFSFLIQCGSASLFIWHSQTTIKENHYSQAQNTAEFLLNAISLGQTVQNDVKTTLGQLANPLIETGQFKQISVLKDQSVIYSQQLPLIINAVPVWFEKHYGFGYSPTKVMRRINNQDFEIAIEMNQAKANHSLYRTITSAIQWVLIGMIATSIALFYALKRLLSPLADLEEHAKAISHKQFDHHIPMPPTRELQQVVSAMNRMSAKLHHIFGEQLQVIQQARTLAYEDFITSLPNVFAFENYIKMMANNQEGAQTGFILLCKLDGLSTENKHSGRSKTDQYIKYFGQLWEQTWQELEQGSYVARRNSSEFFAWVKTENYAAIQRAVHNLNTLFQNAKTQSSIGQYLNLHMSMHYFDTLHSYEKWSSICAILEQNVQLAIEHQSICIVPDHKTETVHQQQSMAPLDLGSSQEDWNLVLTRAISEKNITLEFQPIQTLEDNQPAFAECFMRLPYQGELLKGSQIWPIIEQLDLTYAFDRLIIQMALAHLNEYPKQRLALNICDSTLENEQFPQWLESTLHHYPDLIDCLYLDVRESFLNSQGSINHLIRIKSIGVSLILDRVIAQKHTIDQFVRLPISALKMNIQFLRRNFYEQRSLNTSNQQPIANEHHQQLFITHLMTLCRSCDVDIIATGIETQEDADFAQSLNVNGMQGYWISPPLQSCKECETWSQQKNMFVSGMK